MNCQTFSQNLRTWGKSHQPHIVCRNRKWSELTLTTVLIFVGKKLHCVRRKIENENNYVLIFVLSFFLYLWWQIWIFRKQLTWKSRQLQNSFPRFLVCIWYIYMWMLKKKKKKSAVLMTHTFFPSFLLWLLLSILLLVLFVQPQVLGFSMSQGCAGGLLGTDPFSISDLSSGTLFLSLLGMPYHSPLSSQTENPPLLFCLLISRFLSSVSIKPMTYYACVFAVIVFVCVCVCVGVFVGVCMCGCGMLICCVSALCSHEMRRHKFPIIIIIFLWGSANKPPSKWRRLPNTFCPDCADGTL